MYYGINCGYNAFHKQLYAKYNIKNYKNIKNRYI